MAAVHWIKDNEFGVSFLRLSPDAQVRLAQVFRMLHDAQQQPKARTIQIDASAIVGSEKETASGTARRGFWEPMDDR